jgi:quinol monooxygenase YgiN
MALQSLSSDTRTARGCIGCSVSTDVANDIAVRYIEDWRTEDDLRTHLRSDTFAKLIALIEDAIQRPRIEFTLPGGPRGLDYVAEVRRALT